MKNGLRQYPYDEKSISQHSILQPQTLLSLVQITRRAPKVWSRSSIKHTAWFKLHLRMSSLTTAYRPRASPPTPPGEAGCCWDRSAILTCLTLQVILRVTLTLPHTTPPHLTLLADSALPPMTPLRGLLTWQLLLLFRLHGSREKETKVSQTLCCQAGCAKSSFVPRPCSHWDITNRDAIFSKANGAAQ